MIDPTTRGIFAMSISHIENSASWLERRKYPRYFVGSGLTLAIDDASLRESIGLGELTTSASAASASAIFPPVRMSEWVTGWSCC